MHLYILTRGIKNSVDQFITELQGKYLPYVFYKGKKLMKCQVQVSVRPIQLWEIVFPEEHKDVMLSTILPEAHKGVTQHKKHNKFIWAIRKALGVEKLPDYKSDIQMPITLANTEVVGIGIKKDYYTNIKTGKRLYNPTEKEKKECWEGL